MSFDVDMDGVVSELDMKYSKAFDLDGDGILSKAERGELRHAMSVVSSFLQIFCVLHPNMTCHVGPLPRS